MRQVKMSHRSALRVCSGVVFALTCGTACADSAYAQRSQESHAVHLGNDCRLAVQALQKGHPAPKTDWALSLIRRCTETGGSALQTLWTSTPTDSVALEQLVAASSRLIDQRVFGGVMATVRNQGAPRVVRLAALRVLAAYVDPTMVVRPDDLAKPDPDTAVTMLFASTSHGPTQFVGAASLPPGSRDETRDLFTTLWRTDADPVVRRAGKSLRLVFFRSP